MSEMSEMNQSIKEKHIFDKLIIDIIEEMIQLWKEHDDYECSSEGYDDFVEQMILEGSWYEDEDNNYEKTFNKAKDWYSFYQNQEYKDNIDIIKRHADKYETYNLEDDFVEKWNLDLEEQLILIAYDRKEMLDDLTDGRVGGDICKPFHLIEKYSCNQELGQLIRYCL